MGQERQAPRLGPVGNQIEARARTLVKASFDVRRGSADGQTTTFGRQHDSPSIGSWHHTRSVPARLAQSRCLWLMWVGMRHMVLLKSEAP
jgi:hypothetical protein